MRPAFWIWVLAAPVLTGLCVTVLLTIPGAEPALGQWMIGAAALSAVVAVPISLALGKVIFGT
jgi:hypothetical protein